jgi:hypothetical protein
MSDDGRRTCATSGQTQVKQRDLVIGFSPFRNAVAAVFVSSSEISGGNGPPFESLYVGLS